MGNNIYVPDLQEITIAALLHDIGKFYQRASESNSLEEHYEKNYCPYDKNYYSHKHAGYTAKFFDINKDIFYCFANYEAIKEISSMHHNVNTIFQKIIKCADAASAGFDRLESSEQDSKTYKNFRNIPLNSVFSMIKFSDDESKSENKTIIDDGDEIKNSYYELKDLSFKNAFPKFYQNKDEKVIDKNKYSEFYKQFINELKISTENLKNLFEINSNKEANNYKTNFSNNSEKERYNRYKLFESSLLSLLEKYLWCIPSATNDETKDISLYDHLYSTASIASTLFLYLKDKYGNDWDSYKEINNEEKFARLIKVDVSGIQKYIFDIRKTTYSSKILRAKSFEVSMIIKAVAQKIKDSLGLDQVSILFEGGGNLQMIIPNIDNKINDYIKIKEEIEEFIFERYFGELNLIFSISDPISIEDFKLQNYINKIRKDIELKSEKAKLTKLQRILRNKGHVLHEIYEKLVNKKQEDFKICQICEKRPILNDKDICEFCNNLRDIGREITKSDLIFISREKSSFNLCKDIFIDFYEMKEMNKHSNQLDFTLIKNKIEKTYQMYSLHSETNIQFGLRLSSPYHVPSEKGEPITFEEIAQKSTGTKKLAMLKGDVNDLGAIFWFGMKRDGKNILSLSRYSNLSRMFDYFFTEILVNIIKNKDNSYKIYTKENDKFEEKTISFDDRIYVVYSGGDDFTLIGSWDAIIEFSIILNRYFKKFTGQNRFIEFSSAIGIFNDKTPALYMAEVCEEKLSEVKKHKTESNVSLFDELVTWNNLERAIENGKKLIEYYMKINGFSRAFIYKLLKLKEMKTDFEIGKNVLKNCRWKALFSYYFYRNIAEKIRNKSEIHDNNRSDNKIQELEEFLLKKILEDKGGGIAIKYALQATKEDKIK